MDPNNFNDWWTAYVHQLHAVRTERNLHPVSLSAIKVAEEAARAAWEFATINGRLEERARHETVE